MSLIEQQLTFYFSSSPENGAKNISADRNRFSVQLDNPIHIPQAAVKCSLEVSKALIWNTVPNISAEIGNNTFKVLEGGTSIVPAGDPGNPNRVITIPDGLYSITELQNYLSKAFANLGKSSDLVKFSQDDATQKVILTFPYTTTQVDFRDSESPNNCRTVLGFNNRLVPLDTLQPAGWSEAGDVEAEFNRTNNFVIRTNLISNGVPVNNIYGGNICIVPITAVPGSQIVYQPYIPDKVDAGELINHIKNEFNFELVDQLGRQVEVGKSEPWSFVCIIKYYVPAPVHDHHKFSSGVPRSMGAYAG